jgi:hypothetical protein
MPLLAPVMRKVRRVIAHSLKNMPRLRRHLIGSAANRIPHRVRLRTLSVIRVDLGVTDHAILTDHITRWNGPGGGPAKRLAP